LSKCGLLIISHQWKLQLDKMHCKILCVFVFFMFDYFCTYLGITNVGQTEMELDGSTSVGGWWCQCYVEVQNKN
jgi:hypothetical protein